MKKLPFRLVLFFSFVSQLLFFNCSVAQLTINSGTQWISSSDTHITLDDLGLQYNAGSALLGNTFQFTGSKTVTISGSSQPNFNTIVIAKTGAGSLQLNSDIDVANQVRFKNGLFYLHDHHVHLTPAAFLQNESETSRFTDTGNGTISISVALSAPSPVNPGNLGAYLSSASYTGNVYVERGHHLQSINTTVPNSIARTYNIQPEDKGSINAVMRLYYFDAEKNGLDENNFVIWKRNGDDTWSNIGASAKDISSNYTEQDAISSFGFFTLSPSDILPVHGLQLSGTWKNNTSALTWTTLNETNNHHFEIERKYPDENNFIKIATVATKNPGGTSQQPTLYEYVDVTAKANETNVLYRLKQVDVNGQFFYSNTITVTPSQIKEFIHKVYPTIVTGSTLFIQAGNMDVQKMQVQIFDMNGRRLFSQSLPYQSQLITLPTISAGSYRMLIQSGSYTYKCVFIK